MKAALEPYKTADGGYGYALEPDGRGPTSQPPHIWTALEALEDVGLDRPARAGPPGDDHGAPTAACPWPPPSMEPGRARRGGRSATEGTLLATALLYRAALRARRAPVAGPGRDVLLERGRRDRQDAPVRGRGRDHVPGRRVRPPAGRGGGGAARAARARAGPRRHSSPRATRAGEIHHPHDFASHAGQPRARRGSATRSSSLARPARVAPDGARRLAHHVGRLDARDRDRVERAGDDRRAEDAASLRAAV